MKHANEMGKNLEARNNQVKTPSRLASFAKYALPALVLLTPMSADAGRVREHRAQSCPPIPEVEICTDHKDPSTCEPAICTLHTGGGEKNKLACESSSQNVADQKTGTTKSVNYKPSWFAIGVCALVGLVIVAVYSTRRKRLPLPEETKKQE